jgi:hypothetical protein
VDTRARVAQAPLFSLVTSYVPARVAFVRGMAPSSQTLGASY